MLTAAFNAALLLAQPPASIQDLAHPQGTNAGIFAFTGRCATCHDTGKGGATDRYALNRHTPEEVLASITTGSMAQYAQGLTDYEKRVVAVYVGGRPLGSAAAGDAARMKNRCEAVSAFAPAPASDWNGWGFDRGNSRFQTSPGLTAADTPRLTLKWAFGFPNGNSAYGQPAVVGGRVFVGADTGFVYSLDASSGCIHWSFRANAGVRTAISIGRGNAAHRFLAYFGDVKGNVYAVDAQTGARVWQQRIDTHPVARVTGGPTLVDGRLYVPISSLEESGAGDPRYPCCTFRGGVAAYDAAHRQARVEVVHDSAGADSGEADVERRSVVGPGRGRSLVVADRRSQTARGLRRHGQRLHATGRRRFRRRRRIRSRDRRPPVDEAGDGQRCLRARVSRQMASQRSDREQVRDLPR